MKRLLSIVLLLCIITTFVGCAKETQTTNDTANAGNQVVSGGETTKTDNKESYEFIFVCPIVGMEYWEMCAQGIADADKEEGTKTQIIGPSDATTFVAEMPNYMESAISAAPDGIMAYAGIESLVTLIDKATGLGIPFLAIDSDAPTSSRIAYVGTDPYNAGYKSGEAMIQAMGTSGKVGILCSSISAEKEMKEIEAFKDAIANTDIEVIAMEETSADLITAVSKMEAMMRTYPEIKGVLCTSAYDIQAAAKVKEEMGLNDVVLIGYDDLEETLEYIRKGVVQATIVQDPYKMGYMGEKLLKEYKEKGSLEQESYDTGIILVTKDNVDNYR